MDKQAVRRTLDQLAAFLELQGGNAARVRAVRHAARSELLATGRSSALDELREQVSPGLAEMRSEEHTSELQSRLHLVCRLLLEKKKKKTDRRMGELSTRRDATH